MILSDSSIRSLLDQGELSINPLDDDHISKEHYDHENEKY